MKLSTKIIINLTGVGLPLALGLFAIPILLKEYGHARFGVLSIIWVIIGYFSIFDLGIGRALTKLVAEYAERRATNQIVDVCFTAFYVASILGGCATVVLLLVAPQIGHLLKIEAGLVNETVLSMQILALGLPFVIVSAIAIGYLEAEHRFGRINTIKLLMGVINFGGPLVATIVSKSLVPATVILVVGRAVTTVMYLAAAINVNPALKKFRRISKEELRNLFGFGVWITISNLISPIMAQLDRVFIGVIVGAALLPIYSVPGDLMGRMSFIPVAMVGVLFPVMVKVIVSPESNRASKMLISSYQIVALAILPISLICVSFSREILSLWINPDFASTASACFIWVSLGFLFNGLARVPLSMIQAAGRPDRTAKIHMVELPLYIASILVLTHHLGVLGGAISWTARMCIDLLLMLFVAQKTLNAKLLKTCVLLALGSTVICLTALLIPYGSAKIVGVALVCVISAYLAFKKIKQLGSI